jgi:hypothetical protein
MIYTFGCSVTKWHWPTWSDWLSVYSGPVTNFAYKGYGNDNIYWTLIDKLESITANDQVIIMWSQNHRQTVWYDNEWVEQKDIQGFFPNQEGKIWYSSDNGNYLGLYRTHPEYQQSLAHMIVSELNTIYNTQQILNSHGCDYTMMFVHNPFLDCRPVYRPKFEFVWHKKDIISDKEITFANSVINLGPVKKIVQKIDWTKFAEPPENVFDAKDYTGMWEYFFNKKEYLIYSHDSDPHPVPLTHHDFLIEKILKQDLKQSKHRDAAVEISKMAMTMPIPEFVAADFTAGSDLTLLDTNIENILNELRSYS